MFRFDEKEFVAELDRKREQQFLKQVRDYDERIAPSMRQKGYKRIDSIERTVVFTFGEVTFSRNRWRKGKESCYPVDEWLGLEKYMVILLSCFFMWQNTLLFYPTVKFVEQLRWLIV